MNLIIYDAALSMRAHEFDAEEQLVINLPQVVAKRCVLRLQLCLKHARGTCMKLITYACLHADIHSVIQSITAICFVPAIRSLVPEVAAGSKHARILNQLTGKESTVVKITLASVIV